MDFIIPDVSAEVIMDVAKILANSAYPMTKKEVGASFYKQYSETYISNALIACTQLGLASEQGQVYSCSVKQRDDIKRAHRTELYLPFRASLQDYAPFLLYIDFVSKGYDSLESAARTRGIFKVKGDVTKIEKSLRLWGIYARLVEYDKRVGQLIIKVEVEKLLAEYVKGLLAALEAELKAKVFIIDNLSPEVFAYLEDKGISLSELSSALLNYEKEPKPSAFKACQTLELFLYRLGEETGANVKGCSGPIELATALRSNKTILSNQLNLCCGIGGIRNMTHHDPDKESGKTWQITPQGSLTTILLVPITMRSLYLYVKEGKQEL